LAAEDGDDVVATTIFITKGIENAIKIYLHKFHTIYKQDKRKQ